MGPCDGGLECAPLKGRPTPSVAPPWLWACAQYELQGRQGSKVFPAPPRGEPPRAAGIPSALRGTELGEALVPVVPDDVVTVDAPDVVGGLEPCDVAGPAPSRGAQPLVRPYPFFNENGMTAYHFDTKSNSGESTVVPHS